MPHAVVGRNPGDGAFVEDGAVVGDRVRVENQAMIFDGADVSEVRRP
jgi:acetyltransferase-like isoleucine patch superfamily enzyme